MVKLVLKIVFFFIVFGFVLGFLKNCKTNVIQFQSWIFQSITDVFSNTTNISQETVNNTTNTKEEALVIIQNQIVNINNEISNIEQTVDWVISTSSNTTLLSNYTQLNRMDVQINQLLVDLTNINNNTTYVKELTQLQNRINILNQKIEKILKKEDTDCFYVIGTEEELLHHNIIEKNVFGKLIVKSKGFDQSFYIQKKIGEMKEVHSYAHKVKVLSDMPSDSYQLREINSFQVIVITDSERFWSKTKYLVVKID